MSGLSLWLVAQMAFGFGGTEDFRTPNAPRDQLDRAAQRCGSTGNWGLFGDRWTLFVDQHYAGSTPAALRVIKCVNAALPQYKHVVGVNVRTEKPRP